MPDQLSKSLRRLLEKYQRAMQATPARMGRADGTLAVPGKTNTIYVTELDGPCVEVLNQRVFPEEFGKLVLIGYDPIHFPLRRQVLSRWDAYPEAGNLGVFPHSDSHGSDGSDPVYISSRQWLHGLVIPVAGSLSVQVYPGTYETSSGWKTHTEITTVSFAASVPATGARAALLVVDSAGSLTLRNGAVVGNYNLVDDTALPATEPGDTVLYAIVCYAGQTEAVDTEAQQDLIDLRFSNAATGRSLPATTAASDFLIGDGANWLAKTLAETVTILRGSLDGVYATLASPALTGTPTAPTPAVSDNDTSLATTAFVMAQRGDIPSGATLPASPLANQLFMHTPAGRRVLMLYTNSAWTPVYSFGTMTVYVDGASGSNVADKGTGTGTDAWATPSYAWSQIPSTYFGNIVIRTAAGTYAETLTCQGKVAGGAYSINIIGAETTTHSGTLTSAVQGTAAIPGSITQTGAGWTTDQHKGDFVKIGTAYRVIESNTSDTLTICGTFASLPSGTFSIVTNATIIGAGTTALMVNAGQAVYFTGIAFSGGTSRQVYPRDGARVYFNNCTFADDKTILIPSYDTYVSLSYCSIEVTASVTAINIILATVLMTGCLLWRSSGTKTGTGVMSQQNSNALLNGGGNVIDNFGVGVYTSANGATFFEPGATPGYNIIKNCSIGIQSLTGGQAAGKSNNQYSGNTTNEVATAASYGYNS